MKLQELKGQTHSAWWHLHEFGRAYMQEENFKPEIRKYGDLRRKQTWIDAYCALSALCYVECVRFSDASELATLYLNPKPDEFDYPLRHQIFEEFIKIPDGLEFLKICLEQLFSIDYEQERKESDGFIELVTEQSRRESCRRIPDRFVRKLTGAAS